VTLVQCSDVDGFCDLGGRWWRAADQRRTRTRPRPSSRRLWNATRPRPSSYR
jgi:hypothetical protein